MLNCYPLGRFRYVARGDDLVLQQHVRVHEVTPSPDFSTVEARRAMWGAIFYEWRDVPQDVDQDGQPTP